MQGAANVSQTYLSFAIGDEVESEDVLQMDPGRGELDFRKNTVTLNCLKPPSRGVVIFKSNKIPGTKGKLWSRGRALRNKHPPPISLHLPHPRCLFNFTQNKVK